MKKLKSLLTILLVLALSLALFTGCGSGQSTTSPGSSSGTSASAPVSTPADASSSTPQKVVMYLITFNRIPDDYSKINDTINQYIAKTYPDANVELDLKLFGPADYANKIQLAQQSGLPMDLFIPLGLQSAIAQNQCADITGAIGTYGKDLTAILEKDFGTDAFNTVSKDGHVYGVPINKAVVLTPTFIFDKDMFAATGFSIDDIKSIWDLDPVFAKIKELYPDVYPYSSINAIGAGGVSGMSYVMAGEQKMDPLGDSLMGGVFTGAVFGDSGKVVNVYETENYRKYVDLMHDWYQKGYMPMDMATSTSTAAELMSAGRLFSTFGSYADASGGPNVGKLLQALTGKNIDGKSIGTFYTDSFALNTVLFGIEGEDYVKVSDHVVSFPQGLDANTVPYTAYLCSGVIGTQSLQWGMTPSTEADYETLLKAIAMTKTAERSPYFGFSFDVSNVINEMTAIQNVVKQYSPGLESGSLDPAETLPVFIQALKDAGIDKVIAEKQAQLDEWIKNQ